MARNKKPQEMTELVISNEQFKNSSGMVDAMMAANAHKFVAEMKLVAEAVLETGEKLLVGRRKINEATGGFTQSFYVPSDKADLITRNINVRRDSYRARDDLAKRIDNLGSAEVITRRNDVVMAERRYDYESANARRLGVRDIHAAGGIADKAKYRDVDHPYATAMYLPLDKAAYEARSGRSRSGWVQAQFNSAMTGESRNERTFARDQQSRAEADRQQKEADRQARESQRAAEKKARAQAQAEKQQQRERERQQKAAEREEARRKKEEQKAEEQSNRERLALFAKIGVMLASVVALIRGISTSLLGAQSRAAGSSQSRLPEGFDLSTPILDGLKEAFSTLDFLGIFTPLVNAVTETVQKIRVQTLEGLQTGLTAAEVRLYDTNDVAHQLAAGTTVGAMKGLTGRARNIIALAQENNLGDDYAKMIMGSGLITELTDYSMGRGGYTTAGVFEDIIDAYFKQFKSGKNAIGHAVAPELLMQELTESIKSLMGEEAASVLNNMMLNSLDGSYYTPYGNFEEWVSSTRTMQLMSQGTFAIPKEQLDYANVLSKSMSDTEAMLQAVFDKFLLGMQDWLASFLNAVDAVAYWFMSDADKALVNASNRQKNREAYTQLSPKEAEARAKAAKALGLSEADLVSTAKLSNSDGIVTATASEHFGYGWTDEIIALYMDWLTLYETTEQARADAAVTNGYVPYRRTKYTPEGLAYTKSGKASTFLGQMSAVGTQQGGVMAKMGLGGVRTGDPYVDYDILRYFLNQLGFGSVDDLFNAATAIKSDTEFSEYSKNAVNLTDLIDQIMIDFGKKPSGDDFTRGEISSFYDEWKGMKTDAERETAAMQALAHVLGPDTKGLKYNGSYHKAYIGWLNEAYALRESDRLRNIMSLDVEQPLDTTPGTLPGYGVNTSDVTPDALRAFIKYLGTVEALGGYNKQAGTVQKDPLGRSFTMPGWNEKDITLSNAQRNGDKVTFTLDVAPGAKGILDKLGLKFNVDSAEGYIDYDSSSGSITLREN